MVVKVNICLHVVMTDSVPVNWVIWVIVMDAIRILVSLTTLHDPLFPMFRVLLLNVLECCHLACRIKPHFIKLNPGMLHCVLCGGKILHLFCDFQNWASYICLDFSSFLISEVFVDFFVFHVLLNVVRFDMFSIKYLLPRQPVVKAGSFVATILASFGVWVNPLHEICKRLGEHVLRRAYTSSQMHYINMWISFNGVQAMLHAHEMIGEVVILRIEKL